MTALLTACALLAMHAPATADEKLSVALWTGIVVLGALCIAGLLFGLKILAGRSTADHTPCDGCGRFIDASKGVACPFCGREPAPPEGASDREKEGRS